MPDLRVTIVYRDVEGVDEEALQTYLDRVCHDEVPEAAIATIRDGAEVRIFASE
jgi:hypothetical protein